MEYFLIIKTEQNKSNACMSHTFADKPNNSKVVSLFAHQGSNACLGSRSLELQKIKSLFVKQCTAKKKKKIIILIPL